MISTHLSVTFLLNVNVGIVSIFHDPDFRARALAQGMAVSWIDITGNKKKMQILAKTVLGHDLVVVDDKVSDWSDRSR